MTLIDAAYQQMARERREYRNLAREMLVVLDRIAMGDYHDAKHAAHIAASQARHRLGYRKHTPTPAPTEPGPQEAA